MSGHRRIEIPELVRLLQGQARSIVADLFGCKVTGTRVMLHDLTGAEGNNISIVLATTQTARGTMMPGSWTDYPATSGVRGGDILGLIAHARFGGDMGEACKWARAYLHLDDTDPEAFARQMKQAEAKAKRQQAEAEARLVKRIAQARTLFFHQAQANIEDTPVDDYLLHDRGIDLRKLPSTGSIRFLPDCVLWETGEIFPAMLLCVVGPDGKMAAVHRTYLEHRDGHWRNLKRPDKRGRVKSVRLALGNVSGGHVSVSKGEANCPLGRAPEGDRVLMAEGFETTADYAIASPSLRCISTISLGNMAEVVMPGTITTRFLVKENGLKPGGEAMFQKAVETHLEQCPDTRVVDTPTGFSDINDFKRNKKLATT